MHMDFGSRRHKIQISFIRLAWSIRIRYAMLLQLVRRSTIPNCVPNVISRDLKIGTDYQGTRKSLSPLVCDPRLPAARFKWPRCCCRRRLSSSSSSLVRSLRVRGVNEDDGSSSGSRSGGGFIHQCFPPGTANHNTHAKDNTDFAAVAAGERHSNQLTNKLGKDHWIMMMVLIDLVMPDGRGECESSDCMLTSTC